MSLDLTINPVVSCFCLEMKKEISSKSVTVLLYSIRAITLPKEETEYRR